MNEIVICQRCKGIGKIVTSRCIDHHRRDYIDDEFKCDECGGTGRLKKIIKYNKLTIKELKIN